MKKFLIALLLCVLTTPAFSQKGSENTLKFLGFPVDGSKEKMIQNLKTKGFVYDSRYDNLSGRFNGKYANIYISTNYGRVDRVYVASYAETDNKGDIIIAFNDLIKQFQNNSKYQELLPNEPIPSNEDIRYEMTIENKRYQASFYTKVQVDSVEFYTDLRTIVDERYPEDRVKQMTDEEKEKAENEIFFIYLTELEKRMSGNVWFMINYNYGKYSIGIYYDNLRNRPNGEDL